MSLSASNLFKNISYLSPIFSYFSTLKKKSNLTMFYIVPDKILSNNFTLFQNLFQKHGYKFNLFLKILKLCKSKGIIGFEMFYCLLTSILDSTFFGIKAVLEIDFFSELYWISHTFSNRAKILEQI